MCTEWGKLSCTSCDTEGADCPVLLEDGAKASNAMRNVVGATVALLVLLPTM